MTLIVGLFGTPIVACAGSSVDVLGTLDTLDSLGMDPKWECFIDGISIGPTSYPTPAKRNNQDLCHSGDIPGGDHVLRLDVTTRGSTFWIDVITYVPLLDVPLDSAVIKVPVTDPAIRFSPEWQPSDAGRKTQTAGSKMAFSFIGIAGPSIHCEVPLIFRRQVMSWFGRTLRQSPPNPTFATYSVDGQEPVAFSINVHSLNTTSNEIYFTTPDLTPGPHILSVTHNGTTNQTPLILDYIYVTNASDSNPSLQTAVTQPLSPTHPSNPPFLSRRAPVDAIAGGVIGGLVLVGVVAGFLFWRLRRRHRTSAGDEVLLPYPSLRGADPFISSRPPTGPGEHSGQEPSLSTSIVSSDVPGASISLPTSVGSGVSAGQHADWAYVREQRVARKQEIMIAERRRHAEAMDELPPIYSPG